MYLRENLATRKIPSLELKACFTRLLTLSYAEKGTCINCGNKQKCYMFQSISLPNIKLDLSDSFGRSPKMNFVERLLDSFSPCCRILLVTPYIYRIARPIMREVWSFHVHFSLNQYWAIPGSPGNQVSEP